MIGRKIGAEGSVLQKLSHFVILIKDVALLLIVQTFVKLVFAL